MTHFFGREQLIIDSATHATHWRARELSGLSGGCRVCQTRIATTLITFVRAEIVMGPAFKIPPGGLLFSPPANVPAKHRRMRRERVRFARLEVRTVGVIPHATHIIFAHNIMPSLFACGQTEQRGGDVYYLRLAYYHHIVIFRAN